MASFTHARDSSTVTLNPTRCKASLDDSASLDIIDYYIEQYRYSLYENELLARSCLCTLLKAGPPIREGGCLGSWREGAALRELWRYLSANQATILQ